MGQLNDRSPFQDSIRSRIAPQITQFMSGTFFAPVSFKPNLRQPFIVAFAQNDSPTIGTVQALFFGKAFFKREETFAVDAGFNISGFHRGSI
jgi:hypothetical protein